MTSTARRRLLFPLCVAALLSATGLAQNVPTGFVVDTLAGTGLGAPNDCCFLPDGRVLIADSGGPVHVYAGGNVVLIGTVPNVNYPGEQDLVSIEADPDFATNGQFYVYYATTVDAFMHLDRFTCTGDLSNPSSTNLSFATSSRHVIIGTLPDNNVNHNGGSARFGPDGMLYLSVGDDSVQCNAQSVTSQSGCLLRLDVSGLAAGGNLVLPSFSALDPGNNPLSGLNDFSQLLIAYGLRNPFRMEIDALTGNLYIGDVGHHEQDELSEYVYPVGPLPLVNFGWPWFEGDQPAFSCGGSQPPGLVGPIVSFAHPAGLVSLIAGARYRNLGGQDDFGPAYEGDAFHLDYFSGQVRRVVNNGTWAPAAPVPGQPNATDWGTSFTRVTSMRLGPDGSLWFTQHSGGWLKRVRRDGPSNGMTVVSGDGQRGPANEAFAQPIVARVFDAQGAPLAGGQVDFSVSGPATLSTSNPVTADGDGLASTTVTALDNGGTITVTASTAGGLTDATFGLFSRKLLATTASQSLTLQVINETSAVPQQVPYIVMLSFPGSPTLPTFFGDLCVNPFYALALVIEDGTGLFGFVSFSGTGGIGSPGMTKVYPLPTGIFAGQLMSFQAIGFDALDGWFRSDCEQLQF